MKYEHPHRVAVSVLVLLLALPGIATAHEVRPGYLELEETAPDEYQVTWKQPVLEGRRLPLEPVLPAHCVRTAEQLPENTGDALIQRWRVRCNMRSGLLQIDGLSRTLTDVLVQIKHLDGDSVSQMLRPDSPGLELDGSAPALSSYLRLGIDHLLFGLDHILFVIGLVLFIPDRWMLLKTITAFTLAHSITLAASVLQLVHLPQQPVEAVIALSILYLARELMLPESRRSRIMKIRPWLMAFAFGLLHGFGFAGALADIGLPDTTLAAALVLFNVGIEIGQLLVIGVLLLGGWLLRRLPALHPHAWQQAFTVVMGVLAGFWTIDRLVLIL